MTIRITTTRAVLSLCLALAYVALTPATPAAADREHQQIMADLRMLQEQTQQLQALMNDLGEALKAVNSRIEDQTGARAQGVRRRQGADGHHVGRFARRAREGRRDQRAARLDYAGARIDQAGDSRARRVHERPAEPARHRPDRSSHRLGRRPSVPYRRPQTAAATPPSGIQPQRLSAVVVCRLHHRRTTRSRSRASRAICKYFPKGQQAHEAQLYIGEALFQDKKDADAVVAYERVIANYPGSASVPTAYYKRGVAFERLGEPATRQGIVRRGDQAVPRDQPGHDGAAAARSGQQQAGEIVFRRQFSVVSFQ